MPDHQRIAQALVGAPPVLWEPGLEVPEEMRALQALNSLAVGYGAGRLGGNIAHALTQQGIPALQGLGESGAIFPEGTPIPDNRVLAKEMMDVLPETQRAYRTNEALSHWHAKNYDWPAVLQDKWGMLKHWGGS